MSFQFQITTPCTTSWQEMQPTDQGRWCQQCSKHVHDFRGMSDVDILRVIAANKGQTCGRFYSSQLNRPLRLPAPTSKPWVRLLTGALLAFGTLASHQLLAQSPSIPASQRHLQTGNPTIPQSQQPASQTHQPHHASLQLDIVDGHTKKPVLFSTIRIPSLGTEYKLQNDSTIILDLPLDSLDSVFTVQISAIEYEPGEITVSKTDLPLHLCLGLQLELIELGGMKILDLELWKSLSREDRKKLKAMGLKRPRS